MDTNDVSEGTQKRFKRIQEIRQCTEEEALEFVINTAWIIAEQRARHKRIKAAEDVHLKPEV